MRELDKVLGSREKVHWEGKPNFWPFVLGGGSVFMVIFGLFWMMFTIPIMLLGGIFAGGFILFVPHLWIGPLLVFGPGIYKYLVYKHMHYAITGKRVIMQKGLIGRDFEIVDFDQITNAEVNVGIMDKLLSKSSGSIIISTAGSFTYTRKGAIHKPYIIANVPQPYKVFKFFKKVSHAVKTDINYPNKYRPKTNPGYRTKYTPKKQKKK